MLINAQLINNRLAPCTLSIRHAIVSTSCLHRYITVIQNAVCFKPYFKIICKAVFRCICEIAKRNYKLGHVISVCLPVWNISVILDGMLIFSILGIFWISVIKIQVSLKSDKGKGHFRLRLMYSDDRLWLVQWWKDVAVYSGDRIWLRTVMTECGCVQWWQNVALYSGDRMWLCTLVTEFGSVQWWQNVSVYSGDKMCLCTVVTECVCKVVTECGCVQWWQKVSVYSGDRMWLYTMVTECGRVQWWQNVSM
jgi:hypothetical protein